MEIHNGHRERMKKSFMRYGLDNFSDYNVLEILLFYALPRKDTNALAHALLNKFGNLRGVFEAKPEELLSVPGVGENAASLIHLIPQVSRRYMMSKNGTDRAAVLDSTAKAGQYLMPLFMYEKEEVVCAVFLDVRCRVIGNCELSRGVVNATDINTRKLIEGAILCGATGVILAHNHPSGIALPSKMDITATLSLKETLGNVGIKLFDHVIIADDDYVSMADSGMLR